MSGIEKFCDAFLSPTPFSFKECPKGTKGDFYMVEKKKKTKKRVNRKQYDAYGRGKETLPFIVKVKPRSVMGDYIALHGLLPENELPISLRHKIPENEIWIRKNVYDDPKRRERILQGHEKFELELMETKGMTYKQAHERAQLHEKVYKLEDWLVRLEAELKRPPYEPVEVIEKMRTSKRKKHKKKTR